GAIRRRSHDPQLFAGLPATVAWRLRACHANAHCSGGTRVMVRSARIGTEQCLPFAANARGPIRMPLMTEGNKTITEDGLAGHRQATTTLRVEGSPYHI